ncbi:hypothetical protein [Nevskia sp.]|uniref:DUF6931 family protein n=1 Tax=Nevskia sp. TaxID=1929292 RepID=UPI0025F73F96|nr:hypothetical protein [Nevskia sp.]
MSTILIAAEQMDLSPEALALLTADSAPAAAVETLIGAGLGPDALKLVARLLPRRYAVGWLCQCARAMPLDFAEKSGAAMAEKWMRDPSEANRRAAFEFANAGNYKTLATFLAAAAGWAGGSLAPTAQAVPVPPPEHLTAMAVAGAINSLCAKVPAEVDVRRIGFIREALVLLGGSSGASSAA